MSEFAWYLFEKTGRLEYYLLTKSNDGLEDNLDIKEEL